MSSWERIIVLFIAFFINTAIFALAWLSIRSPLSDAIGVEGLSRFGFLDACTFYIAFRVLVERGADRRQFESRGDKHDTNND